MQISDILKPDSVKILGGCSSKKRLFNDLADIAAACYGLENARVVNALTERETLGPTTVGQGIALPHARLDGLDCVAGVFVRLERPVTDYKAADRQPVDLVFALLAPAEAGAEHLRALAAVSRTLRQQTICAKLRANADAETLYAILTDTTASRAA